MNQDPARRSVAYRAKRKAYLNMVLPAFLISIIAYLDRNNLSYAKLTMNAELGFTDAHYGFGAGIFFAGYILFEIPGALIAERYSARLWLSRIMITWGLFTALMAWVTQGWQFYALRFLIGAAEASLYPVLMATMIPRWFVAKDRPVAIAMIMASLPFSSVLGAPIAGWLIDTPWLGFQGWQVLFIVEAIPALLLGLIVLFWLADRPESAWWLTEDEKDYFRQIHAEDTASHATSEVDGTSTRNIPNHASKAHYTVWQALSDREVLKLCLTYFLWLTGYWGFNYFTPSLLKDQGWSNQASGWLFSAIMAMATVVMLAVGFSSSRTGERRWHGASGMFLAAVGLFGGTMVSEPVTAFLFLCAAGIGVYSAMGVWWSYPTTFLRGAAAAGAVGLINSVGNIGGFVGPTFTGTLKEWTGNYTLAWVLMSIFLALAGLLVLTLKQSKRPNNNVNQ